MRTLLVGAPDDSSTLEYWWYDRIELDPFYVRLVVADKAAMKSHHKQLDEIVSNWMTTSLIHITGRYRSYEPNRPHYAIFRHVRLPGRSKKMPEIKSPFIITLEFSGVQAFYERTKKHYMRFPVKSAISDEQDLVERYESDLQDALQAEYGRTMMLHATIFSTYDNFPFVTYTPKNTSVDFGFPYADDANGHVVEPPIFGSAQPNGRLVTYTPPNATYEGVDVFLCEFCSTEQCTDPFVKVVQVGVQAATSLLPPPSENGSSTQ